MSSPHPLRLTSTAQPITKMEGELRNYSQWQWQQHQECAGGKRQVVVVPMVPSSSGCSRGMTLAAFLTAWPRLVLYPFSETGFPSWCRSCYSYPSCNFLLCLRKPIWSLLLATREPWLYSVEQWYESDMSNSHSVLSACFLTHQNFRFRKDLSNQVQFHR